MEDARKGEGGIGRGEEVESDTQSEVKKKKKNHKRKGPTPEIKKKGAAGNRGKLWARKERELEGRLSAEEECTCEPRGRSAESTLKRGELAKLGGGEKGEKLI